MISRFLVLTPTGSQFCEFSFWDSVSFYLDWVACDSKDVLFKLNVSGHPSYLTLEISLLAAPYFACPPYNFNNIPTSSPSQSFVYSLCTHHDFNSILPRLLRTTFLHTSFVVAFSLANDYQKVTNDPFHIAQI